MMMTVPVLSLLMNWEWVGYLYARALWGKCNLWIFTKKAFNLTSGGQ